MCFFNLTEGLQPWSTWDPLMRVVILSHHWIPYMGCWQDTTDNKCHG